MHVSKYFLFIYLIILCTVCIYINLLCEISAWYASESTYVASRCRSFLEMPMQVATVCGLIWQPERYGGPIVNPENMGNPWEQWENMGHPRKIWKFLVWKIIHQ